MPNAHVSLIQRFKNSIPWQLRIGAKIFVSRLPVSYLFWKRLGVFEHGEMNDPKIALETFLHHARTADLLDRSSPTPKLNVHGELSVLELGPGDSLFTAVVAKALGASRSWLVDADSYATMDMSAYAEMLDCLHHSGFSQDFDPDLLTWSEVLGFCNAKYLTEGIQSLTGIPTSSVDFCFSNAVLEHIPRNDFQHMVKELKRVLKSCGVCVHRVDLKDHLGGALNNLRFSEETWEGSLFRRSGFYTNRLRYDEMIKIFQGADFECHIPRVLRWDTLPTAKDKLNSTFRLLPDDDLLVSGFDVVLRHKG